MEFHEECYLAYDRAFERPLSGSRELSELEKREPQEFLEWMDEFAQEEIEHINAFAEIGRALPAGAPLPVKDAEIDALDLEKFLIVGFRAILVEVEHFFAFAHKESAEWLDQKVIEYMRENIGTSPRAQRYFENIRIARSPALENKQRNISTFIRTLNDLLTRKIDPKELGLENVVRLNAHLTQHSRDHYRVHGFLTIIRHVL